MSRTRTERDEPVSSGRRRAITICRRPVPVDRGTRHPVTCRLEAWGYRVTETDDGAIDLDPGGVLWLQGNPTRFPKICRQLAGRPRHRRPLVVLWFSEPLPPPLQG